jgi:glycosyltransferase involved in cell wall biosynthesis
LPNTVMESLSCGVPVAAFNIGGMPDMIEHKKNGYLAEPYSIGDLAEGIYRLISDKSINEELRKAARTKTIDNFSFEIIGKKYKTFYEKLLNQI